MLSSQDRWLHSVFSALAVLLVAFAALAMYREGQRPLQVHQRSVAELAVIDRCETCHDAAAHSEPWLTQHPVERFACTPCHGGQGLATTAPAAHRATADWQRPLFTRLEQQAACGTCHREPELAGAPLLNAGRKALAERGCGACHLGPPSRELPPAPDLDGLASKTTPGWLRSWLRDPTSLDAHQNMPRFRLQDQQIEQLVAYLWGLPGQVPLPQTPTELTGDSDRGKVALATRRCATCHTYEGRGGAVGPDLSLAGHKIRPNWLLQLLTDTHKLRPLSPMPGFQLPAGEAQDIAAYVAEQWIADSGVPPWAKLEAPVRPHLAEQGRALFGELGCAGCHRTQGGPPIHAPRAAPVGPSLAALAGRHAEDLPHPLTGAVAPLADVPSYVAAKVLHPQGFDVPGQPAARMPLQPRMTQLEAEALGVAVAALRPVAIPQAYQRFPPTLPGQVPAGPVARLVDTYRCLVCHQYQGQGGSVARVALDGAGTRLNQRWLQQFLREPLTVRMDQPERMPVLGLGADQAELLTAWLLANTADPRVTPQQPLDPREIPRGKSLFAQHQCGQCHVADGGGTMRGPTLDGALHRLHPDYAVALLHQGPALLPEQRHPASARFSLADARALAVYVLSLPAPWPWAESPPEPGEKR